MWRTTSNGVELRQRKSGRWAYLRGELAWWRAAKMDGGGAVVFTIDALPAAPAYTALCTHVPALRQRTLPLRRGRHLYLW